MADSKAKSGASDLLFPALVVGVVGLGMWWVLKKPSPTGINFKGLKLAGVYSEDYAARYTGTWHVPIAVGSEFGGTVSFQHKGLAANLMAWLSIESRGVPFDTPGNPEMMNASAASGLISVPMSADWITYTVATSVPGKIYSSTYGDGEKLRMCIYITNYPATTWYPNGKKDENGMSEVFTFVKQVSVQALHLNQVYSEA